jgi:biotin carboxyl carrier protein
VNIDVEVDDGEIPREHDVRAKRVEDTVELEIDGHEYEATTRREDGAVVVDLGDETLEVAINDGTARVDGRELAYEITDFVPGGGPGEDSTLVEAEGRVVPPMPGKIVDVFVEEGDAVEAGDELATLEAMKMQSAIEAPREGTVLRVNATPGEAVEDDTVIFEIGDPDAVDE